MHSTRNVRSVEIFSPGPLRVTHIPRTLVDLAGVMPWTDHRALADSLPQLPVRAMRAAQERAPRRPGAALVARLIEADDAHTKSEFERRFLRFLKAHGLPAPHHLDHAVARHQADWVPDTSTKLVVEDDEATRTADRLARLLQMRPPAATAP